MSEKAETPQTPTIVNDPIIQPIPEALRAARERAEQLRRGERGVPTREAREKLPMNTMLRRGGFGVRGLHPTDDRGQYRAIDIGANDPCPCNWAAEHPHKFKRHEKVAGPLIRKALDQALVEFKAKQAAEAAKVPAVAVEPTKETT